MNESPIKFYMSGPYKNRVNVHAAARLIEKHTGWQCTSRWMAHHDDRRAHCEVAKEDIEDLKAAEVFVMCNSHLSSGGANVEFGIALELGFPIYIYGAAKNNVFMSLPQVHYCAAFGQLIEKMNRDFEARREAQSAMELAKKRDASHVTKTCEERLQELIGIQNRLRLWLAHPIDTYSYSRVEDCIDILQEIQEIHEEQKEIK